MPHSLMSATTPMDQVNLEVKVLRAEVLGLKEDILELKDEQKELIEFMYRFEGGKASLFALLTVSATVGALISSIVGFTSALLFGTR